MAAPSLASMSLSRRFALSAAILSAAAILLISLISLWLVSEQRASAAAVLAERELGFHARSVGTNLQSLTTHIGDVANNPILATALVDSAGKELYLLPFLQGVRQINGIPVAVALTDFEGKPIATNGADSFSTEELAWLRQQIAHDSDRSAILQGPHGDRLLGVHLMRYSRTSTPEGALFYKVRLRDLLPVPWSSFAWEGGAGRFVEQPALQRAAIPAPPVMAHLQLRLEADARALAAPLNPPTVQYIGIAVIALVLAGVVYLVGVRLAHGLTRDLRRLEAFASKLDHDAPAKQYAELVGSKEVVNLARSINRMLDRLYLKREHLQRERKRFYQLANTIPQLAWMAEPDGTITWYNDRWYEYTGLSPKDMQGDGLTRAHDPSVLPSVMRDWKAALASGKAVSMTFPLRGADGRYRRFFTSFAPLRDEHGNIIQWFGTNTDMSQIEQAEQAVQRSEERLRQGLVAARMAVWDWSVPSGALSFAANLKSVFGAGFANMRAAWALFAPTDLPELRAAIDSAVATQGDFQALVRVRRADDHSQVWLDLRGRAGIDTDGNAVMNTIAIDVTERKRAEEALRLADQRKDEFLAMLAHELRNPLAPIGSAAAMLGLAYAGDARVRHVGEIIGRQVAHMTRLVNDLLDVSRVTSGLVTIQRERVDLRTIANEAVEQIRPLALARAQQLESSVPDQPVWLHCDQTRLVQVVTNLLNNSVKYTPKGGSIRLTLGVADGMADLRVRDNGAGISADLMPDIFELFTQGKRTLDRAEGGLGLGLALARKLVELHGGTLTAISAGEGKGSEFSARLPLDTEQPAAAGPLVPDASAVSSSLRLLIVDDNADAADSLAMLLEVAGHRPSTAYSARSALELSGADRFDAMMLDLGMPDIDGYELAERLRAAGTACPLIAVTGYGQERDKRHTRAAGFSAHLVKPIDADALAQVLEQLQRGTLDLPQESAVRAS
jgi:PAS domain S-box-containing protein